MKPGQVSLYCGHHKCASHWIRCILKECCQLRKWEYAESVRFGKFYRMYNWGYDREKPPWKSMSRVITWMCAEYPKLKRAMQGDKRVIKGFHVVRHPADVWVSAFFSHKYSHSTKGWRDLIFHREKLLKMDNSKGLLEDLDFSATQEVFQQLRQWDKKDSRFLNVKMEDMINPEFSKEIWIKIFIHMGWDITPEEIEGILNQYSFKNMSTRKNMSARRKVDKKSFPGSFARDPGQEDSLHHYRKGIPGDWKNKLKPVHIERFLNEWGDVVEKWGYKMEV